jgi:predicted RNase H-like HicB family nuclease
VSFCSFQQIYAQEKTKEEKEKELQEAINEQKKS